MSLRAIVMMALLVLTISGATYGEKEYDITPIGARSVYVGHQSLLPFWVAYQTGGFTRYFYYEQITGVPPGVTAEVWCNANPFAYAPCSGSPLTHSFPNALVYQAVRVTASRDAVPGEYVLTLHTRDHEGHSLATPIPLTVLPEPEIPSTPATYQPLIPTLATWKQKMVSEGTRFCNASNKNQTYGFGYEGSAWFYDGARVFYQIYDATGEDIWRECAENVATQYADYVNGTCQSGRCGGIPGWRVFPRGLRMAYERTGAEKYRTAVENLAANGSGTDKPGWLLDTYIRETAYAADSLIEAKLIHSPNFDTIYGSKLRILVDELLAMYAAIFDSGTYILHQSFYDALAAEALIDYYTFVTPDPRIPPAIRKMLDWTWTVAWDEKAKQLGYQRDHVPWTGKMDLLGLSLPAYAWYYSITGDVTYLQRGDEMFGHVFDTPFWSGKQFTQTFRGTFEYVKWRSPASDSIGISLPEHLYPSGRAEAIFRLPQPAGGKCGGAIRFNEPPNVGGWPASVPFAVGSTSKIVRIRPHGIEQPQNVTFNAVYRNSCDLPEVTGKVKTNIGPDHLDVVLSTMRIPGGIAFNNKIVVHGPDLPEGTPIVLTADRPELVRFFDLDGNQVTSVRAAGGKGRSHFFYLDAGYAPVATPVMVSASVGELKGSATFIIDPPAPRVVVRNGTKLVGGFGSCFNQVIIDQPAPTGGMAVSIWTDDKKYFADVMNVTVPEGQISAFFCATAEMTPAGETVLASQYGKGKFARRTVLGESRTLKLSGIPATIRSGAAATGTVTFDSWIPGNTEVRLTSSDASIIVPGTVTIARSDDLTAAGKTFAIQAGTVSELKTVRITAVASTGHEATFTVTATP